MAAAPPLSVRARERGKEVYVREEEGGGISFGFAKQRTWKTKEERVSGWFIESLRRRWIAEGARQQEGGRGDEEKEAEEKEEPRGARGSGRLYSFQAQKLNLISNINLFSLRAPLSFSSRSLLPSVVRPSFLPV